MNAQIAFYKGTGDWKDSLIRFWTRSIYSHVEIVYDGYWYSISPRDNIVYKRKMDITEENWDLFEIEIDSEHLENLYQRTKNMKYDWIGIIFSQIIPLRIDRSNNYICSEWCAEGLKISPKISNRFSPGKLANYVLSSDRIFN